MVRGFKSEAGYCMGLCSRQYSKNSIYKAYLWSWDSKRSSTTLTQGVYNRMSSFLSDIQVLRKMSKCDNSQISIGGMCLLWDNFLL